MHSRKRLSSISQAGAWLYRVSAYHLYTLLLFTWSDLKTTTFPDSTFGLLTAIATIDNDVSLDSRDAIGATPTRALHRIPLVLIWVWVNQLVFNIGNQQRPESIAEDSINKPWRPMPSKRLSATQAELARVLASAASFALSRNVGGLRPCITLMFLGSYERKKAENEFDTNGNRLLI